MQAQTPSAAPTSVILLLSLKKKDYWDEQHSSLVDALSAKATIKRATKPAGAVTFLTNNTPSAIIITDGALTELSDRNLDAVRQKTVEYVRARGGVVVIATHFSSFVQGGKANRWFSTSWGLPWKWGDYYRTTVHLNPGALVGGGGRFDASSAGLLPQRYSQKAVFLKNVHRDAAVYLPSDESRVESLVPLPGSAGAVDDRQTPVAFASVGHGWLGYVGDVNNEAESEKVILAMCGL